jgi:transposase
MRTPGSAAELEARRRRAVAFLAEGKSNTEAAALVGASVRSVVRWKQAWRDCGERALAAKPQPGPQPKLSSSQKKRLVKILVRGPLAAGYRTDLWTCRRVAEVILETFGVSYHPDHVGRILHALSYSPQKPQRRARKHDAAAIEHWRKVEWPRIKKGAAKASYHRVSR